MSSKPEKIQIFATIPCWLWVFVLLPMFMPFVGLGIWDQWEISVWLEIFYHVANGILMLVLMLGYLKEEWFMVTTDVPYYLKHILLTVGLIAGAELVLLGTLFLCDFHFADALECLPMTEMSVSHTPAFALNLQPIFGTIAMSLFAPISVCALFYCLGFATVCNKKPWLAYLSIVIITLLPPVFDIIWRDNALFVLCGYLISNSVKRTSCHSLSMSAIKYVLTL
jgi:hypothetical protein